MSDNTIKTRVKAFGKRLLDTAKDEYYDTPAARIDTIVGSGSEYYLRLRAVKQEWDQSDNPVRQEFQEYLRETYGIEMTIQPEGIDLQYRILDEQKHTLFLLKFGG
jgi:hypothetical protein